MLGYLYTTLKNTAKETREQFYHYLNLPSGKDLNADSFKNSDLQLQIITTLRDSHTNHETLQWIPLVVEIDKQHSEKQVGWRAFYLNSGHRNSNEPSREVLTKQIKTTLRRIKYIVKSNLLNTEFQFHYKVRRGYNPKN